MQGGQNLINTHLTSLGEVVFPDTEDSPALPAKRSGDKAIPQRIGLELLFPKWPVVYRQLRVLKASMPETAINENDDTLAAKGEIRLSKMLLTTTPSGDAMRPEKVRKGKFSVFVAVPAYAGHDLRAFFCGENVRHGV